MTIEKETREALDEVNDSIGTKFTLVTTQPESVRLTTCTGSTDKARTFAAWMKREYPSLGVEVSGLEILVARDGFNIVMPLWQAYFNGWYDGQEAAIAERMA